MRVYLRAGSSANTVARMVSNLQAASTLRCHSHIRISKKPQASVRSPLTARPAAGYP